MCSPAKISRMETAGRGVLPRDVRDLGRLYQVSDEVRDELIQLANDARKPGWWQKFGSLDEVTSTFLGLEAAADAMLSFQLYRIPGLLQTPEYTKALISHLRPQGALSKEWI